MKNKNYDVYMILQEDKSEYIFKYFEKDFMKSFSFDLKLVAIMPLKVKTNISKY